MKSRESLPVLLNVMLAMFLLVGRPAICQAEEDGSSANYVMPGCRAMSDAVLGKPNTLSFDNEANFKAGACMGEIIAAAHFGEASHAICWSRKMQNSQLLVIVTREIESEPTRWREGFLDLATEALIHSFPCR